MKLSNLIFFFYDEGDPLPPVDPPVEGFQTISIDLKMFGLGPQELWESVVGDLRTSEPPVIEYGIRGQGPSDRIADAGVMTFALHNQDADGDLGRYSPFHPDVIPGFEQGTPLRFEIIWRNQPYYKFYGKLASIDPTPGVHEDRMVRCTAYDLIDDWARSPLPSISPQFNQRSGELVQTLLNNLPSDLRPASTSIEQGLETFRVAFDTFSADKSVREGMNEIALSGWLKTWIIGTTTAPGGRLIVRGRHYTALNPTVRFHLEDDIVRGGLSIPSSRDDLVSQVQVFGHPTRVGAIGLVLFSLETSTTAVQNGRTLTDLVGQYTDPLGGGGRVAGAFMEQPLPFVDYTMNSAQDGSGTDLTAQFTVVADYTRATEARFTIANNAGIPGFITLLQVRGAGFYRYETPVVKDVAVNTLRNVEEIDMPFQDDMNFCQSVAEYVANTYAMPRQRVASVTFLANRSVDTMRAALELEPGDRFSISEAVSGLDAHEFIINAVRYEIQPSARTPLLWTTWYPEPADTQRGWVSGVPGSSEAGVTTYAAF